MKGPVRAQTGHPVNPNLKLDKDTRDKHCVRPMDSDSRIAARERLPRPPGLLGPPPAASEQSTAAHVHAGI